MAKELEKAAKGYKAKTRVECDGFHPNVPLDLTKETRGAVVDYWRKWSNVGDGRNKLAQLCFS